MTNEPNIVKDQSRVKLPLKDNIIWKVEVVIVTSMQLLLVILICVATFILYALLVKNLLPQLARIESAAGLIPKMQESFAGVLTVILGLELLETLKAYFTEHHVRLEVIVLVAIIAVARHLIQFDFEHASGTVLLGLSAVILALAAAYFLIKKTQATLTQS